MKKYLKMAMAMALVTSAQENMYHQGKKRVAPNYRNEIPKPVHRPETIFKIKGIDILACSKKDAIKRYNHLYKNKRK